MYDCSATLEMRIPNSLKFKNKIHEKGQEFWAGVVFASSTFLKINMGPQASALRANVLYVAMSRFRDELAVELHRGHAG
jgi:hypothetical protein